MSKKSRTAKRMKRNASRAPRWVRDIAAADFNPAGVREFKDSQLGTFGAASPVRHIDPEEYEAQRAAKAAA